MRKRALYHFVVSGRETYAFVAILDQNLNHCYFLPRENLPHHTLVMRQISVFPPQNPIYLAMIAYVAESVEMSSQIITFG